MSRKNNILKLTPRTLKRIIQEEKIKIAKELKASLVNRKKRKSKFQKQIIKEAIQHLIAIKKEEVRVGKEYKRLYEQKQKLKHNILKRL